MYGGRTTVDVKVVERDERILVEWGGPEDPNSVEWTFEAKSDERTFVRIRSWGVSGNADEVVAKALASTGGFHLVLAGAKFFLEHGIQPDLLVDRAPDAIVSSWSRRDDDRPPAGRQDGDRFLEATA
jgi:hypothetical protein